MGSAQRGQRTGSTARRVPAAVSGGLVVSLGILYLLSRLLAVPTDGGRSVLELILRRLTDPLDGIGRGPVIEDALTALLGALLLVLVVVVPVVRLHRAARELGGPGPAPAAAGTAAAGSAGEPLPRGEVAVPVTLRRGLRVPGSRAGVVSRSVGELRRTAKEAGIPWRPEFATPGGGRALLELVRLRAGEAELLDAPGTGTRPDPGTTAPAPGPDPALTAVPAPAPERAPAASLLPADVPATRRSEPAAPVPGPEPAASPASSLSGSFRIGSVYTRTTLYTPGGVAADADPEGAEDASTQEEPRP